MVPDVGSMRRFTSLSVVVLPQPDSADEHTDLARGDVQREVADSDRAPSVVALGDMPQLDGLGPSSGH